MTTTIKLKWVATDEQMAVMKRYAKLTGQASIRDFMGFAVSEYIQLLTESLERTRAAAAEAAIPLDQTVGAVVSSSGDSALPEAQAEPTGDT